MTAPDFFNIFFDNLLVFILSMACTTFFLFIAIRRRALAGYLDPIHFYWTFTIGSAYGIVLGLYLLGSIRDFIFFWVFSSGGVLLLSYCFFSKFSFNGFFAFFRSMLVPQRGDGKLEFYSILVIYIFLISVIIYFVGVGLFADTNRFEQNRGFGAFVRVADAFRLFLIAYISLLAIRKLKLRGVNLSAIMLIFSLVLLIVISSAINGSKFALLESLYACFVASSIYWGRPRFKFSHVIVVAGAALAFAMLVLYVNLQNNNVDTDADSRYMGEAPVVVERLVFRVLGNGDKYYLGLPNDVIDEIEIDNVGVRFLSPLVGVTKLSSILGYNVNDFNVGRQIMLHFDPNREVAGGPTSHFDLFAYKYFGVGIGYIWIVFTGFILSTVANLGKYKGESMFYAALVSALWLRTLPILLEPPVGVAYILDIFLLFFLIKVFGLMLPRRNALK